VRPGITPFFDDRFQIPSPTVEVAQNELAKPTSGELCNAALDVASTTYETQEWLSSLEYVAREPRPRAVTFPDRPTRARPGRRHGVALKRPTRRPLPSTRIRPPHSPPIRATANSTTASNPSSGWTRCANWSSVPTNAGGRRRRAKHQYLRQPARRSTRSQFNHFSKARGEDGLLGRFHLFPRPASPGIVLPKAFGRRASAMNHAWENFRRDRHAWQTSWRR